MRIKVPPFTNFKFILFLLLAFYASASFAQEKDTVLFIPKTKFQISRIVTKTDSINLLKRRAVLTAKTAKELRERMAELDSILLSYKNQSDKLNNIIKADSIKTANNTPKTTTPARKRPSADSIRAVQKAREDQRNALRLARLNAIVRRNDSIKLVKAKRQEAARLKRKQDSTRLAENKRKLKLRNDSLRVVKAQELAKNRADSIKIAQKLQLEKRRQDSIQTAIALQQRAKIRADSIRVAQAKILADQIAKRKQDSINTVIALQEKARLRADSIRVAQAKILADQIAKRKQDSINTVIALQEKARLRADSIRVAQANIIAQRRRDSIQQVETLRKTQLRNDSIRVAQANIAAQRRRDSISTVLAMQEKARLRADSIRIAQANIAAQRRSDSIQQAETIRRTQLRNDSIRVAQANIAAQRKRDSINTVLALQEQTRLRADSIRIAQANIAAQRRRDSINAVLALQEKTRLRADSIRIAQANIAAQRRSDSIQQVETLRKTQLRNDSIRVAQANIAAQRRRDSINTVLALQEETRLRADSIRIAQANIVAQRKKDSIDAVLALQETARLRADSIRIAQANIAAQRMRDSIQQVETLRKTQLRNDSIRIAQANIAAQRRRDSIDAVIALQEKARLRTDSIRIAQANILAQRRRDSIQQAETLRRTQLRNDSIRIAQAKITAQRKQDSISSLIIAQQKAKFQADSLRVAKLIANETEQRKQDSISNAINTILRNQRIADSVRVAQQKIQNELDIKRREDSIINSVAKSRIDDIYKANDSSAVANNNSPNRNRRLIQSDLLPQERDYDTLPFVRTGNILTKFVRGEMELKQGQIVSNVLKVVNVGRQPVTFTTDLLIPGAWTRIDDENKQHVAKQFDTIIVPVIISPTKLVNGNTEIIINGFIVGSEQQQLANNFFSLRTRKQVSWEIELSDIQNMYLKNEEENKRFRFQVHNSGNYRQDLFVNYSIPKKDLFLADTLGKLIKQPNVTFSLEANQRKKFDYLVTFKDMNKRNMRRISYDSYDPNKVEDRKVHSLIVNTSEPRSSSKSLQKRTKVNFVKLPNEIKANPYGYPYLPLTLRMSAQNILSDRSFLSLNLRGFKQIDETASVMYSADISYSNSYFTNDVLRDAPWYVGYFDDKKSIEIGQVSGSLVGVSSSGKGVKGSYKINDQHRVGAYYLNSGGFIASNSSISFGAWHTFDYNDDISVKTQVGRNVNSISNRSINVFSIQPNIRIQRKHSISLIGSFTNKKQDVEPTYFKANGLQLGTSYSSSFINKRLRVNFSARYNDRNFSYGNYDRLYLNQRTSYVINDKWNAFLSNNYQKSASYNLFTNAVNYSQNTLYNNLVFTTKGNSGSYQPGIFYEYRNYPNSTIHNRGLTFRYSNYNFEKNLINSLYLKAGYTKPVTNNVDNKDYFNFELGSLTRYRTWNFNAKYNLGAFSTLTSQQTLNDFITPQAIRVSAQNQYLFSNKKLVVESNAIYSYNNVFNNHTLGIYPTVYFFNNSGWRFGMSANYIFSTSDYSTVFDSLDNQSGELFNGLNQTTSSNFNLNFSLKKDFGIPIPFVDKTAATGNFVAFLDLNGNGIKDDDESILENVVVKVGKKEVLTNVDGEAVVKNLLKGEYDFDAFSLENLNGWFPNVEPKIYIENDETKYVPFVRGIKVFGDVVLDRQKIAVADEDPVDLSRIKISATIGEKVYSALTNASGRFEFYLPYGDYVITMDEGILNDRLQITRNNIPLKLKNTQDGVYVSFYIIEKRRKVIFTDFTKKKN